METSPTTPKPETTPTALSPIAEKLLQAVADEIKGDVIARHKINKLSPSFPYHHRTMANRDCLGTGVKEFITVGGRRFYLTKSLLDMLRADLSKTK